MTAQLTDERTLTRITAKQHLGPDAQSDDKAQIGRAHV